MTSIGNFLINAFVVLYVVNIAVAAATTWRDTHGTWRAGPLRDHRIQCLVQPVLAGICWPVYLVIDDHRHRRGNAEGR